MFADYYRIVKAIKSGSLKKEWNAFVCDRMSRPWDGDSLNGHVPFKDFQHVRDLLRKLSQENEQPKRKDSGLYIIGAWTGNDARLQYIGISDRLRKRWSHRYFAGRIATHRPSGNLREINCAEAHGDIFRQLIDDYTPLRNGVNMEKFPDFPISIWKNLDTRLPRAERFAKVGLGNLWYFPIPAPAEVELRQVEEALVQASNARLYEAYARGEEHGWPLLNVDYVKDEENRFLNVASNGAYQRWLRGSWWASVPQP